MPCSCVVSSPHELWDDTSGFDLAPVFDYVGTAAEFLFTSPPQWVDTSSYKYASKYSPIGSFVFNGGAASSDVSVLPYL